MKPFIIPVHSFVDLITNSSSEVFVWAGESTVEAVKELVNNILKLAGSTKTSDDLFTIEIASRIWCTIDGKRGDHYLTDAEIDKLIEQGVLTEDDKPTENYDGISPKTYLRVTPKSDDPVLKQVCTTLSDLTGLFDMQAVYN